MKWIIVQSDDAGVWLVATSDGYEFMQLQPKLSKQARVWMRPQGSTQWVEHCPTRGARNRRVQRQPKQAPSYVIEAVQRREIGARELVGEPVEYGLDPRDRHWQGITRTGSKRRGYGEWEYVKPSNTKRTSIKRSAPRGQRANRQQSGSN